MRIVIVGQKWFGAAVLELCQRIGMEIVGVLAPRQPPGSEPDRLLAAAEAAGVPFAIPFSGAYAAGRIFTGPVDVIVAAHAWTFIPAALRQAARYGAIGYHPSLLPLHRGRDAVRWAIRMGDRITGGSVYQMTDEADAGPVLAQDWCFILPGDTPGDLWRRVLAPMGLQLLEHVLADLPGHLADATHQIEALATWEPALCPRKLADESPQFC